MKKSILIACIVTLSLSAFAQQKPAKSKPAKPVTRLETAANFNENKVRDYKIEDNNLLVIAQCASYGFDAWIKTTTTPANQIDANRQQLLNLLQGLLNQQAALIKADTAKKVKADTTTKKQ